MLNGNLNKLPEISQYRSERMVFDKDAVQLSNEGVVVSGHFIIKKQIYMKLRFELVFEAIDQNILRYQFSIPEIDNKYINTLRLNF